MNKVSIKKNKDYTVISNVFLRDINLSLKAKGFLAVIMSLSDDWDFSINGICSIVKEGKSAVYSIIDELKEFGYCSVTQCRDDKGKMAGNDYTFYEQPHTEEPHTENPHADNQPQLNTNRINNLFEEELKEKERNQKKEEEALYKQFEAFAKEYKKLCGKHTVSGIKTLFNDFIKRHKDWQEVVPILMQALHLEDQARKNAIARKEFYPMPKNLSTYLGKQRAWEAWLDDIGKQTSSEYAPQCDGISLFWNEVSECYITPFDISTLADGYNANNRPNGAEVMWRGYKYIWDSESKDWIRQ